MRIDKLWIKSFKNLKDLTIDIDQSQMTSVFIGKTAQENLMLLRL